VDVRVAVELHQPERERRGIAVAHHRRAGVDTRADEQACHGPGIQQSVLAVLQIAIDVLEHGTGNVTLVVRGRTHVNLDEAHLRIVKVLLEPIRSH
jgi:hypothetical protein